MYKLRQNDGALAVVPSNACEKLCGFGTFKCPPSAMNPVMMTIITMMTLMTPRMFSRRSPQRSFVPCRRDANVRPAQPIKRGFQSYLPESVTFPAVSR